MLDARSTPANTYLLRTLQTSDPNQLNDPLNRGCLAASKYHGGEGTYPGGTTTGISLSGSRDTSPEATAKRLLGLNEPPLSNGSCVIGHAQNTLANKDSVASISRLADLETHQVALAKVKRIVSFFKKQLHATTDKKAHLDPTIQHIRDLADALDAEVQNAGNTSAPEFRSIAASAAANLGLDTLACYTPGAALPHHGGYEGLRQTLLDAQRRCDKLTEELLTQSQTNDDLLKSLTAAKDTNKVFSEQIQVQSDQISALSSERICDKERIEQLQHKFSIEKGALEADARSKVSDAVRECDAKLEEARITASSKLRRLQSGMEHMQRELNYLRQANIEQRRVVVDHSETMRQCVIQAERNCVQLTLSLTKRHQEVRDSSIDCRKELEMRLAAEHDMRASELASWNQRHALLTAERDNLQARLTADVSRLRAQVQAAETNSVEGRRTWVEERSQLQRRCDDLVEGKASVEAQSEQLRQNLLRAEAANTSLEHLHRGSEAKLGDLRRQLSSANEALLNVELLRDDLQIKLDEQKRELLNASDAAVINCRQAYQSRIERMSEETRADRVKVAERLQQVETSARVAGETARVAEAALEESKARAVGALEDAWALRQDLNRSRLEIEELRSSRKSLEAEISTAREEFVDERARLQAKAAAQVARLEQQLDTLACETKSLRSSLQEAERRDAQESQRRSALEAGINDRDLRIKDFEQRLQDGLAAVTQALAEAAAQRQRALDAQAQLDKVSRETVEERRRLDEERRRLEDALADQTSLAQERLEQHEKLHDSSSLALTRVQTESSSRILELNIEKDKCKAELSTTKQQLAETQVRLETADQDLARVRYLLTESQSTIEAARESKEQEQRESLIAGQQMQREMVQISAELKTAKEKEELLTRRHYEATTELQQEHTKAMNELQKELYLKVEEYELRLERLRTEYESRIESLDSRHSQSSERERVRIDAIIRENEQLRRWLAERKGSQTEGISSLRSDLESSISQLQQQTRERRLLAERSPNHVEGIKPFHSDPESIMSKLQQPASPHRFLADRRPNDTDNSLQSDFVGNMSRLRQHTSPRREPPNRRPNDAEGISSLHSEFESSLSTLQQQTSPRRSLADGRQQAEDTSCLHSEFDGNMSRLQHQTSPRRQLADRSNDAEGLNALNSDFESNMAKLRHQTHERRLQQSTERRLLGDRRPYDAEGTYSSHPDADVSLSKLRERKTESKAVSFSFLGSEPIAEQ